MPVTTAKRRVKNSARFCTENAGDEHDGAGNNRLPHHHPHVNRPDRAMLYCP